MYLSLTCLFVLSLIAQVATPNGSQESYWLMLAIQVVILMGIIVRGGIDWLAKRKAHGEHLELLAVQKSTSAKVDEAAKKLDENTELTKNTTARVRHDVRGEITALSMVNELNKRELAVKVEAESHETRKRFEELTAAVRAMGGHEKPQPVEVVNSAAHPVPVTRPEGQGNQS